MIAKITKYLVGKLLCSSDVFLAYSGKNNLTLDKYNKRGERVCFRAA